MAAALPYVATIFQVGSTIAEGRERDKQARREAEQLRLQGIQDRAEAQVEARAERRRAELLSSRLKALAGASGTSVSSPNVVNELAEIDERGAYNSLAALYSGATSESSKRRLAKAREREGSRAKTQSYWKATGQVLSAGNEYEWWG